MRFIWHYDEKTSALIKTMKYERYISLAKWCASKIVSGLSRFSPTDWDFVLPIPLDTKSVRQRGFDQCAILGSAVAKKLSITCENNICCRKKLVTPQATLSTAERLQNVRNLFKVERDISNKNILLVDDVVTTGATISSLALELRKAGAQSIDVLSLARSDGWHTFRYRVAKAFPFEAAVAQAST